MGWCFYCRLFEWTVLEIFLIYKNDVFLIKKLLYNTIQKINKGNESFRKFVLICTDKPLMCESLATKNEVQSDV